MKKNAIIFEQTHTRFCFSISIQRTIFQRSMCCVCKMSICSSYQVSIFKFSLCETNNNGDSIKTPKIVNDGFSFIFLQIVMNALSRSCMQIEDKTHTHRPEYFVELFTGDSMVVSCHHHYHLNQVRLSFCSLSSISCGDFGTKF